MVVCTFLFVLVHIDHKGMFSDVILNLGARASPNWEMSIEEVNQFSHFLKFCSIILVYAFSQM